MLTGHQVIPTIVSLGGRHSCVGTTTKYSTVEPYILIVITYRTQYWRC